MITPELVTFIKEGISQGKTKVELSQILFANGWKYTDVEEAFAQINPAGTAVASSSATTPASAFGITPATTSGLNSALDTKATMPGTYSNNIAINNKPKSRLPLALTIIILLLLAGAASAYFFKDDLKKLPFIEKLFPDTQLKTIEVLPKTDDAQTSKEEDLNSTSIQDADVSNSDTSEPTDPTKQTEKNIVSQNTGKGIGAIKIISPVDGQKLVSDSTITVKYEVQKDNVSGQIFISGCGKSINAQLKGIYSFECKVQTELGPLGVIAFENSTEAPSNQKFNDALVNAEVVPPANIKPIKITVEPGNMIFGVIRSASNNIQTEIKYSDGITRRVPMSYFDYSLDNPSLITFLKFNDQITNNFTGNKVGDTILHLKYQGISQDVPVNVRVADSHNS